MGSLANQNKRKSYKKGWKFVDDYTGFVEHSDDAVRDWRGFITTSKYVDEQHPQEMKPPTLREDSLPFTRPEQTDTYVDPTQAIDESEY